jgi:hypothetical protein
VNVKSSLSELLAKAPPAPAVDDGWGECPPPHRWWAVALGESAWTETERNHTATCQVCRRTLARFRGEPVSFYEKVAEYGLLIAASLLLAMTGLSAGLGYRNLVLANARAAADDARKLAQERLEKSESLFQAAKADLAAATHRFVLPGELEETPEQRLRRQFWDRQQITVAPVLSLNAAEGFRGHLGKDVVLGLDRNIGTDMFTKVAVCWDYRRPYRNPGIDREIDSNSWETQYYWRSTPLRTAVPHQYGHDLNEAPRPVTTVVRLWVTDDPVKRQKLGIGADQPYFDRAFTLESRPEGIAWRGGSLPPGVQVAMESQKEIAWDGALTLTVATSGSPQRPLAGPEREGTTLHVVVRAKNGSGPWVGPNSWYYIAPQRLRPSEIGTRISQQVVLNLPSLLGPIEMPSDQWPTELETILVALPFDLARTQVAKSELDLESDCLKGAVLQRATVRWSPDRQAALLRRPGSPAPVDIAVTNFLQRGDFACLDQVDFRRARGICSLR